MRAAVTVCLMVLSDGASSHAIGATELDFASVVRPILSEHCFECHGPDAATRQADLRLDQAETAASVLPSAAGAPSELLKRISSAYPDVRMPPVDSLKQLDKEERAILVRWLHSRGDYLLHWAFAEPARPVLPETVRDPWCSNQVDGFILDRLRQAQLTPAEGAAMETLLRRVTIDLTGLPPTPAERLRFLGEVERVGLDRAYEMLVERLLPDPSYAEHMTLPWLEAARYADTDGYQNNP